MPNIVNAGMALSAMRYAPYSTPSALAELIDNSIQAKATNISLIAKDSFTETATGMTVSRLNELGVYDDGIGMDKETIESALAVGFSRNKEDPSGIGKFGFGMTVGSVSQCYRVEVYSWQNNGPIFHTYIDLNELLDTGTQSIPEVVEVKKIPLLEGNKDEEGLIKKESGTLVRWLNLDPDKVKYKTSNGIYAYLNSELGRIYRHFLDDDDNYGKKRNLRIISLSAENNVSSSEKILANDPLYLLTPNTLPPCQGKQYKNEQTNVLLDEKVHKLPISFLDGNGEEKITEIEIRATVAKPEIRSVLGGTSSVGKHYAKNTGISFVRAGREINLMKAGYIADDTRERWWGIEIRFDPCLDEIFGVTNDKQFIKNIKKLDDSIPDDYYEDADEDFATSANIQINDLLKPLISKLREIVKLSKVKRGPKKPSGGSTEEQVNTRVKQDSTDTKSKEAALKKSREEKIKELAAVLIENDPTLDQDQAEADAEERIDRIVDFQLKSWPGSMFLERDNMANGVHAQLNIRSAFYKHFYDYLEGLDDSKPAEAVKIILMAYIRTEDELAIRYDPDDEIFPAFRERWGHWVQELIKISDDSV